MDSMRVRALELAVGGPGSEDPAAVVKRAEAPSDCWVWPPWGEAARAAVLSLDIGLDPGTAVWSVPDTVAAELAEVSGQVAQLRIGRKHEAVGDAPIAQDSQHLARVGRTRCAGEGDRVGHLGLL